MMSNNRTYTGSDILGGGANLIFIIYVLYLRNMDNIIVANHDFFGSLWLVGWLFTIGYLRLSFWQGVLGLIIWPYKLGVKFHTKN